MKKSTLILGDIIVLAIITVIGFATHGETGLSYLPRMATTFLPLLIGWFLVSPWFELFNTQIVSNRQLYWRPALAMVIAAPMVTILRAAMLRGAALPIFTLVLGSTSALAMLIWRTIYRWLMNREK